MQLKTALGMSFISMISMELAMNLTDVIITGGAAIKLVRDTCNAMLQESGHLNTNTTITN